MANQPFGQHHRPGGAEEGAGDFVGAARHRADQDARTAADHQIAAGEPGHGAAVRGAARHSRRPQGSAAIGVRCHHEGRRLPRRSAKAKLRCAPGQRHDHRCDAGGGLSNAEGRHRPRHQGDLERGPVSDQIGARVPRLEDFSLLTGGARFVDDIPAPGALHAAFVRSPHPHALIRGIDAGTARAMPSVVAVLTLDDLAPVLRQRRMVRVSNSGTKLDQSWPFALADGEVSFVGEPVAIVVASDRYMAEDATAAVVIDYDVLPAATDCRVERAPTVRRELATNRVIAYKVAYGDSDAAFAKAAHVVHEDLWVHRGAAHSMEGRGILVQISDRETQIWASTQKAHDLKNALADYIDLDESRLRVATPDVGGGFGPN